MDCYSVFISGVGMAIELLLVIDECVFFLRAADGEFWVSASPSFFHQHDDIFPPNPAAIKRPPTLSPEFAIQIVFSAA